MKDLEKIHIYLNHLIEPKSINFTPKHLAEWCGLVDDDFEFINRRIKGKCIRILKYNYGLFNVLRRLESRGSSQIELLNRFQVIKEIFTESTHSSFYKEYYTSDHRTTPASYVGLCELNRMISSPKGHDDMIKRYVRNLLEIKTHEINSKSKCPSSYWTSHKLKDHKELRLQYLNELVNDIKLILNYEE